MFRLYLLNIVLMKILVFLILYFYYIKNNFADIILLNEVVEFFIIKLKIKKQFIFFKVKNKIVHIIFRLNNEI